MSSQRNAIRGGVLIATATLIAGLGGYGITILAARSLQSEYVYFAAFWAFLYLAVGTFSGFQQEISRGTSTPRRDSTIGKLSSDTPANTWLLASGVAVLAAGIVSLFALVFGPLAFGELSGLLLFPLVIGLSSNVFLGALTGILYGTSSWWPLTLVIIGDVALRFILLITGFSFGLSLPVIAWLVVAPYGLVIVLCWTLFRRELANNSRLDVGYRAASLNVFRTILASLGIAILVSGMPLFIASVGDKSQQDHVSAVIFSLVLTRAPLVVGVLALQSFLVVYFRDHSRPGMGSLWRISALVSGSAALISVLAWIVGADLIALFAGENFRLNSLFIGLLTLSSLPTALLAVAGSFVLAKNMHTAYSLGWMVAAVVAMTVLFLPLSLDDRVLLSLGFGPILGLVALVVITGKQEKFFSKSTVNNTA